MLVYPVILAGGSGSRLWPLSGKETPKQFLKLFNDRSLLQNTLARLEGFVPPEQLRTSCLIDQQARVEQEVQALNLPCEGHVFGEPVARNTAPAIYLAARRLYQQHPDALLVVLPADHYVADTAAFQDCLSQALVKAQQGVIVTLGIHPTAPETGYGYIEVTGKEPLSPVLRFVEKPDLETAVTYLGSGRFLWNSGIFVFRADVMLEEFRQFQPEIVAAVDAYLAGDLDAYANAPKISVDYAIMERTQRAWVVRATFGWSDVGTWNAVAEFQPRDDAGNTIQGKVYSKDCRNSLIRAEHRQVTALGITDTIIVETESAVLVCHRDYAQAVGQVPQSEPDTEALGYTEHRPWGSFTILNSEARFKTKRLEIRPGKRLSLQSHQHRREFWLVVSGMAQVTLDDNELLLKPGDTVPIPVGAKHRVANPGPDELILFETQIGDYFGEDDITRYQDDFHRM